MVTRKLRERLNQFWKDEGVPLVIRTSEGDGGTVFVQGADRESKDNVPTIVLDADGSSIALDLSRRPRPPRGPHEARC